MFTNGNNKMIDNGDYCLPAVRHVRVPITDHRHEESRLDSFINWPPNAAVTPDDLANAGFYYTGRL